MLWRWSWTTAIWKHSNEQTICIIVLTTVACHFLGSLLLHFNSKIKCMCCVYSCPCNITEIQGLAQEAIEQGVLLWKIRPKMHKCLVGLFWMHMWFDYVLLTFTWFDLRLDHLVLDQAKMLNPLVCSNYSDEDMMGKVKQLAKSSAPQRLGFQVLERYSAFVSCRWMKDGQW